MTKSIFEQALSIYEPWYIEDIDFNIEQKKLDIFINFRRGSVFRSYDDGYEGEYKAYDTVDKTWRHLNFFEHECYLRCRTPRIKPDENHIELVNPPWSGYNTGFTLLFEALILQLCQKMTVKDVSRLINETDKKIWRLLEKYIDIVQLCDEYKDLNAVGVDETSKAKGHDYITLFVDLKQKKTIFVAEGKDHKTIKAFADDLPNHEAHPEQIMDVSSDMSPAFIKGVNLYLPNAQITFDKFHVLKLINEAVDQVRREEVRDQPTLIGKRYLFLKNENNLTEEQKKQLNDLKVSKLNLKTMRALHIRENFQAIYKAETEEFFIQLLNKWYFWATHSRLEPIKKVAKTIKAHWNGIISWKRSQINNGILEGLNSIIQAAKSKARGFRTFRYFRIMVFLTTGKLDYGILNYHYKPLL